MGMTSAERQRAYRQRHLKDGIRERINLVVSVSTKRKLERLARHYGVTQVAMLERLLAQAEREVVDVLEHQAAYYDGIIP